jgi:hypothetical protein
VAAASAGVVMAALAVGRRAWTERSISFGALLVLVLALAVAAPIAEHVLLGVEYPNERIALYYVPVAALLVLSGADEALGWTRARRPVQVACVLVAAALALHFARTANLRHTRTWFYDANTRAAILEVERRFGGSGAPVSIGNGWMFEPTINYYRATRGLHWLLPATRDRLGRDDNDVVYCHASDVQGRAWPYRVMQAYPDTGTVLYAAR